MRFLQYVVHNDAVAVVGTKIFDIWALELGMRVSGPTVRHLVESYDVQKGRSAHDTRRRIFQSQH